MKRVKILLGTLILGTAVLAFAACNFPTGTQNFLNGSGEDDEADTETIETNDYISGTASNATVDYTSTSENGNFRNLIPLKTKHYGSRAVITQTNIDTNTAHGIMGYAFNVIYHKKGDSKDGGGTYTQNTADFTLVSVTYAGSPIYYISAYRNITDFQGTNFGVDSSKVYKSSNDLDGSKFRACTDPCEYEIVALPSLITTGDQVTGKRRGNLPTDACTWDATAKTFKVAINVTAETNGSYTVDFYNPEDVLKTTGSWVTNTQMKTKKVKKSTTIPAAVTGYDKKTQALLGVYANIYPLQTLKGKWRLSSIKGEAEVEEFEY